MIYLNDVIKMKLERTIDESGDYCNAEAVTGMRWQNGDPWMLWVFDHDVDLDGATYRCVIVDKIHYDPDDLEAVNYTERLSFDFWPV